MNLYDRLLDYGRKDCYPMHMPGHKRNSALLHMTDPYSIDITEIDGFDNLHHAEGILRKGMERAAGLYGSEHTDYLIGGSTAGILTGISACTGKGDRILVARNSHKSVYHGIYLRELEPVYVYPRILPGFGINGGISPEIIEELLIKYPDIKLVLITSPTYEGILSDIKEIAHTAHRHGVPLMVDEAHGAHLGFHPGFPAGSVSLGADIVIHSIHKTLPAFTQTALIHVNGSLVDYEEVKRYLGIYQSSSPSYVLMAGIEQCITLLEQRREELFSAFDKRLRKFYLRMEALKHLKVLTPREVKASGSYEFDPSKINLSAGDTKVSGKDLYEVLLHRYRIQMEMSAGNYVLGMTSIADTEEGFQRLGDALLEMDKVFGNPESPPAGPVAGSDWKINCRKLSGPETNSRTRPETMFGTKSETKSETKPGIKFKTDPATEVPEEQASPERAMLCHDAYRMQKEVILLSESTGRIAAEYIYLYPPGIPLLVPGERINGELLARLSEYREKGLSLQGLQDMEGKYIKVVSAASEKNPR